GRGCGGRDVEDVAQPGVNASRYLGFGSGQPIASARVRPDRLSAAPSKEERFSICLRGGNAAALSPYFVWQIVVLAPGRTARAGVGSGNVRYGPRAPTPAAAPARARGIRLPRRCRRARDGGPHHFSR